MYLLAHLLESELGRLLRQWNEGAFALLDSRTQPASVLGEFMPSYVRQLIAHLREDEPSDDPALRAAGQQLGAARFRAGFELEQVVREYGLLTRLLLDVIDESELRVSTRELRRLVELMTAAVADATAEYARREKAAALQTLEQSNRRLSRLFEDAPASIAHLTGPRHVYTFANRLYRQALSGHELIGLAFADVAHAKFGQTTHELLDEVFRTGQSSIAREVPVRDEATVDGPRVRLFDFCHQATRDEDGEIDGVLMHAIDVTESVRHRDDVQRLSSQLETTLLSIAAARESERELRTFRAVLEASSDFIAFGPLGAKPAYVNRAGRELVGIDSLEHARTIEVCDYFPEGLGESHMAKLRATLRDGHSFHADTALRDFKTGEAIPVSQSAFTVADEDGRPLVLATIMRDRREAERAESERAQLLLAAQSARREADAQRSYLVEAFTQAPVAVGIFSGSDNVVTLANPSICRIWGRSQEQLIGRPFFDVAPELRGQGFEELLSRVRATGVPFVGSEHTAKIARAEDGEVEEFIVNFVYQPLAIAGQVVSDVLIVATDVTGAVQKRRAAEAVSAEFETMFNYMPDGAYLTDRQGIVRANPAGLALFGVDSVEEIRGPTAKMLETFKIRDGHGRVPDLENTPLASALRGELYRGELIVQNLRSAEDVRVRAVASPVRMGEHITGAVIVNTDISEQHRAFEQLQRSEHDLQTLAGVIPQQVWRARADGALDLVNQQVLDYFGVAGKPMLGDVWQRQVHPDDLPRSLARWQRSVATGEEYETEFRLRRHDGSYRWHLVRARPARDASGTVVRWFGTNTDIDESRKSREQLEQRSEFEQHLVGIVSHDLRNPLNVILAGTATLLHMEELGDRATKVVTRIHAATERASRMIRDLLDFTQARLGGGLSVVRRPGDLYKLTSIALEEVQMSFSDRRIELTRAGNTLGYFDADRMSQVIFNLLTNALHYSDPSTPVTVRVAGQGDAIALTVHNQGAPISQAQLARIFQPLQRASDQIDFRTRSVGLGLYIVDAIVKAHEGTVNVESSLEAGTKFVVRVPRSPHR